MSDIVERLRNGEGPPYHQDLVRLTAWLDRNWKLREEAAAEIERLRANPLPETTSPGHSRREER